MSNSQVNAGSLVGSGTGSGHGSAGSSGGGAGAGGGSGGGTVSASVGGGGSGSGNGSTSGQQQPPQPHLIGATGTATIAISSSTASVDNANMAADSSPRESGDDSEDESEILEESPCGRWLKRREEVDQRDVPGIDCVHLAMDTEEGVEVVWNEVQYANLQELKSQEDKMRQVFDNLLQLDHQNIVKFHRYWTDTHNAERPRVIFITEYMSSGSLKQFLKRTKRNAKRLPLEAWRRWCTQILSALSYLHSCTPPVMHGNLTCDSIFIQHNGLVKIGSVVPDAVHYNVRQHLADMAEHGARHFMAPEYGADEPLTAAVDIYAFGMCALEMAALEIQPSSNSESKTIGEETILKTINSLEHDLQRDLIFKCLRRDPFERPSASDLLFHPLLFEVHSLKLLSAHSLVSSPINRTMFSETVIDGMMQRYNRPEVVMATINFSASAEEKEYRLADVPTADKLEKFVEDVKYGVYPLTAFSGKKPPHFRSRAASPERADSVKSATPEPVDIESRRIVNMMCSVKKIREDSTDISMTILLRMDDKMNRQLTCQVTEEDSAADLTQELVRLGFVHVDDEDKIQALLEETLRGSFIAGAAPFEHGAQPLTFSATINEQPGVGGTSSGTSVAGLNIITSGGNIGAAAAAAAGAGASGTGYGNDNVITATTTSTTSPNNMATLYQFERSWCVADTDHHTLLQQVPPLNNVGGNVGTTAASVSATTIATNPQGFELQSSTNKNNLNNTVPSSNNLVNSSSSSASAATTSSVTTATPMVIASAATTATTTPNPSTAMNVIYMQQQQQQQMHQQQEHMQQQMPPTTSVTAPSTPLHQSHHQQHHQQQHHHIHQQMQQPQHSQGQHQQHHQQQQQPQHQVNLLQGTLLVDSSSGNMLDGVAVTAVPNVLTSTPITVAATAAVAVSSPSSTSSSTTTNPAASATIN